MDEDDVHEDYVQEGDAHEHNVDEDDVEEGDGHEDVIRKNIDRLMEKSWKEYRYEIYQYFKRFQSTEEARQHPYGNVTQEDWNWLCTFFDNKYSERRPRKDPSARAQLPYSHRAWLKSSLRPDEHEAELFHGTHLPATPRPETEELDAETEELRVQMDDLRGLVQNQKAEFDMIRATMRDQQDRLKQLEERVFGNKAAVVQDQEPLVWDQQERLRRLEERVFADERRLLIQDPRLACLAVISVGSTCNFYFCRSRNLLFFPLLHHLRNCITSPFFS